MALSIIFRSRLARARCDFAVVALLGITASLILAGCGGSGSSGDSSDTPVLNILSPVNGASYVDGESVPFRGTASDPQDGELTGDSLVWRTATGLELGTGGAFQIDALALGQHTIILTATDAGGIAATESVTIRIVEPPADPQPRFGETSPYAGRISRTPAKLDDELVVVGRASSADQVLLGVVDDPVSAYEPDNPSGPSVAPREVLRRDGVAPLAAAAGRVIGSNVQQVVMLSRATPLSGSGAVTLEVLGLYPGQERMLIARQALSMPCPAAPVGITVADVDAFDEVSGDKVLDATSVSDETAYHDEAVLAYPEMVSGALRARVRVLSFEDVDFPESAGDPVPGPTSDIGILTSAPMRPSSRIVVAHGDQLTGTTTGPHIVVAYVDVAGSVAVDVFEYQHTRTDPANPDPRTDMRVLVPVPEYQHAVLSSPLSDAAVLAGGWDLVVARANTFGMDMVNGDVLLIVSQGNGQYSEAAWKLEDLAGFPGPYQLASQTGEFGRVSDGAGGEIPLSILADSPLRAVKGRIVDPPPERCEAAGLFVLADTNRGAIVQSMSAFIDDPFLGNARFGPVGSAPTWPHVATIRARPETTTPSGNALAAGGFVSERNALIDERGKPSGLGTEYASNCQNVASLSYLGPMPSFYVADPVSSSLHAVTTSLGSTSGGGRDKTAPLDATIDLPPLLLSADTDGNAGYYQAQHCLDYQGSSDCRRVYLGDAEVHYVVENVETSSVVLQQPPKHVDYLPELGGMVDVSMSPAYYAEFAQTTTASGRIDQRGTVDLTFGEKVGGSVGKPTLPGRDFNALLDLTLDAELQTVAESFAASQATVSLSQTTGAVDDDVIWSRVQTVDYWRFPAQGGKSVGDANSETRFGDEAYVEVAIPEEPVTVIGPGVLNDNYQPTHQPGNILTYPTITGDVTDIGELFNFLGSYLPTDPNGARPCLPLSVDDLAGCVISVNDALVRVAEITTEDAFIGGEFQTRTNPVDVADTLQVGGITYSAELEFSEDVRRGQNVTNKVTLKAETNANVPIKIPVKGIPVQVGTLEAQFRAAASYEEARLAENTLSTETRIALHVPAEIPVERSYRIRPSFGFTPAGSLDVRYQVGTSGVSAPFWQRHYSAPDPALNMPHRIVRRPEGWRLGTDFSRNRIKGFFARDGSGIDPSQPPGTTVGPVLTAAPATGEPVQLEARVYNLSVATAVEGLTMEFSAQPYENGAAVGTAIPLGATVLDYIPYRGQFADDANAHIASAYLLWDTAGFGPLPGNTLATYVINVTLDPGDGIPGERHELFDRFQDPLIGPVGEPIDPALEKGQNNRGWAMVRIAPPVGTSTAPLLQSLSTAGPVTAAQGVVEEPVTLSFHANGEQPEVLALEARLGEPLELSIALDSSRLHRGYGLLQVFDGPPDQGGEVILSRTVQGLSGAQRTWEPFTWRANAAGPRVLHAVYRGSGLERDAVGKLVVLVSR